MEPRIHAFLIESHRRTKRNHMPLKYSYGAGFNKGVEVSWKLGTMGHILMRGGEGQCPEYPKRGHQRRVEPPAKAQLG